jgi:peptidyl-tRNA hydrolase, PTH1 family
MIPDVCIIGLGNPGDAYASSRHNLGFMTLDALAQTWNSLGFSKNRYNRSSESLTKLGDQTILLLKPQTFMNLSGESLNRLKNQLEPKKFLVIYDDIDLPLGTLRIRAKGSAGSHNGMKSILKTLGTQEVPRIRVGIRPDFPISDLSRFVLGNFSAPERDVIKDLMPQILQAIEACLEKNPTKKG